jgi:hypothetical protein
MPFPATEEQIAAAERELGVTFPDDLRARLLADNGGDVAVDDWPEVLTLYPVWDDSDRARIRRTANHVVRENRPEMLGELRELDAFPADAIAIGASGGGDLLVLLADGRYAIWDHEPAELLDASVIWLFPGDHLPPHLVDEYEP